MPIVGINAVNAKPDPVKEKEESPFDAILKGLSLANSAFGIYSNVKDIELKSQQLSDLQRQSGGTYTPAELAKSGLQAQPAQLTPEEAKVKLTPEQYQAQGNLLPGMQGPPAAPGKEFQGVMKLTPANLAGPEGSKTPISVSSKDELKDLQGQKQQLLTNVKNNELIQVAQQQASNLRNLESSLAEGGTKGQAAAAITAARMLNPGVRKMADGSVVGIETLPGEIQQTVLRAFGDPNFQFGKGEEQSILNVGRKFFSNAASDAKDAQQQGAIEAVRLGVDPKSVGLGAYDDLLNRKESSISNSKKSYSPEQEKLLTDVDALMAEKQRRQKAKSGKK